LTDFLQLTAGPPANGGSCVARHDGRVVFVRYALPDRRSAQAFLRQLFKGERFDDVDKVWEWMAKRGDRRVNHAAVRYPYVSTIPNQ